MNVLARIAARTTLRGKLLAVLDHEWPRPVPQSWLVRLVELEIKHARQSVGNTLKRMERDGEVERVAGRRARETYWSVT